MKKLTDEQVAIELGWKWQARMPARKFWKAPQASPHHSRDYWPPSYTTSLDAIVAEIEARGLVWYVERFFVPPSKYYFQAIVEKQGAPRLPQSADTAPLALCEALLAYLKEKP